MPNTYTQFHIQLVFAAKYRAALIGKDWKERLHQYITGIFQNNGHKMLQIQCARPHLYFNWDAATPGDVDVDSERKVVKHQMDQWVGIQ